MFSGREVICCFINSEHVSYTEKYKKHIKKTIDLKYQVQH